jgi:3-dehydroquinate synthase
MSGFRISHGEAVATGVLLDSIYAALKSWISADELSAIREGLRCSGFQLWFDELAWREPDGTRTVFAGLRDFQEHLGGELTVTFPQGIGARQEVHEIDLALMEKALQELEAFARSR